MITAKIGSRHFELDNKLERYFAPFREQTIGHNQYVQTPFGQKRMIYADWTASGRLYRPIEQKLTEELGPFIANTHTESNTVSAMITAAYRHARKKIKEHVHANEQDILIMDGFGMTSVVNKLQRILGLRLPENWAKRLQLKEEQRPIIFISHMEHHSNHTSWLETIGDVRVVQPNKHGHVDIEHLERLLQRYASRKLKIGSFTACSNVTGIQTPYHQIARKMHEHDGYCFVDFAAAAPYTDINMHPADSMEALDAIFFSPHKFLGGPGSSGVLIFNSKLYKNIVPDHSGGGTVAWTNPWGKHKYLADIELREDGGTPGILQTIKAALCIELKEQMGTELIHRREQEIVRLLLSRLEEVPNIRILEKQVTKRLGIISFTFESLHYHLVVKLLNDHFGYQVRGGCSCAGTYGHYLLDIDPLESKLMTDKIDQGDQTLRRGWVRFSVHPTMTNAEIYGFVEALKLIAKHADEWKKDYVYDRISNEFVYAKGEARNVDQLFQI
ncbi:aminotransferase class V-fold PLP-dependent enzyme [Bacillus horti]|uniref:Selenocysteine lyase/cysteine desulfurase n=1 Tax=Caldalkalibacillus horti TaxID=77523 RepID=A0ABT9VVH8_9BACI|nr:aminotransferase class V-fold PLP-dependent enzyme [Bacillus horti]MDQ0164992.1 selenocysteine lyase/cysteine desulfurase [Bacillus horti]